MAKHQTKPKIIGFLSGNISSVFILALIPAIVIIFIQPIDFKKYKAEQLKIQVNDNRIEAYEDLDADGNSEFIRIYNHTSASQALQIINKDNVVIGQYNTSKFMPVTSVPNSPLFMDLNRDSIKEILYFSQYKDSLFLSIFNYAKYEFMQKDRFITTIGMNGKKDFEYRWVHVEDINDDGFKEAYFNIITGFALYPRKIFRYDVKNDNLISSINTGAPQFFSTFRDASGKLSFWSNSNAYDNCHNDFPYQYRDTCSWIFAYDKDLNLKFPPIYFAGKKTLLSNIYKTGDLYYTLSKNGNEYPSFKKFIFFNEKGNRVFIKETSYQGTPIILVLRISGKERYFFMEDNFKQFQYVEFNPENSEVFTSLLSKKLKNLDYINSYDIDKDTEPEFLFQNKINNEYYLYRNNLENSVLLPTKENTLLIQDISSSRLKNEIGLILTSTNYIYTYSYFNNPLYFWKYPFWFLVYLLSAIFIWFAQLIPKRINKRQDDLKNRIIDLQLKNTQNQLDPHFTFNALNVVASKIYKEDRKTAYDLFERFSRLMRSSLAYSDQIFRPLGEELQFTEDYLEFQKTRFQDVFEYQISQMGSTDTSDIQIPKMLIQGFAENSVKHAFKGIDYKGCITISIRQENNVTLISIEDDGIGIKRSTLESPLPASGYGIKTILE